MVGAKMDASEVSVETAKEMAAVGIVPSAQGPDQEPIGFQFEMAGQVFSVMGYATKEEFLARAREVLPLRQVIILEQVPDGFYFQRISTD